MWIPPLQFQHLGDCVYRPFPGGAYNGTEDLGLTLVTELMFMAANLRVKTSNKTHTRMLFSDETLMPVQNRRFGDSCAL